MSIFDIFKRNKAQNGSLQEPEFWGDMLRAPTGSGISVNSLNAMQIAAVYACVRVLSETIAGLPVKVYRKTPTGRQVVENHRLDKIFNAMPNNTQTSFELLEHVMSSLALHGNSYCLKLVSYGGDIVGLEPLMPNYMKPKRAVDGSLEFHYNDPTMPRVFKESDIWRVAGLSNNGVIGLSPIALARESLGLALASESSAAHLYSNGNQLSGVLKFPGKLDNETINRLRNQWETNHGGAANAHRPMILESGMEYSAISMSAKDAQFLEARKFQISEIARWFRVPMHKLSELDRATFSNIEHQSIEFVQDTILPWCRRIEQSIMRDLMSTPEQDQLQVRFNLSALLRGDTATRYEAYKKAITDGWMSRNEVRKLENLNPADGLDEYLVPLNMGTSNQEVENRVSNWMATREINAINNTLNQDDPEGWALNYYTRQAETLGELTNLTNEQCAAWALGRMETLKSEGSTVLKATAIKALMEATNG